MYVYIFAFLSPNCAILDLPNGLISYLALKPPALSKRFSVGFEPSLSPHHLTNVVKPCARWRATTKQGNFLYLGEKGTSSRSQRC